MSQASGNARDLVALKTSLEQIPELKARAANIDRAARIRKVARQRSAETQGAGIAGAQRLQNELQEMPELAEKLSHAAG